MSDTEQPNEVHCVDGSNEILIIEASDQEDILILNALPNLLSEKIQEAENNLFWQPTRKQHPLELETEEFAIRNLSAEGLYVPQIPKVFYQNVLEQRLSLQDDNKWFNCDGRIKMLEIPLASSCCRSTKSYFSALETHYKLPTDKEEIVHNVYTTNILEINIINIKFEHHPLFSVEHIFERRLLSLYDSYKEKCIRKDTERMKKKLETLRNQQEANATIHINEVKKVRELLFKEAREYRNNIKLILQTWKIIKKIRDTNGYSNTSVKLTIQKENCNFEQEHEAWAEDINRVISEIQIEKQHEYENELTVYKEEIAKWKANKTSTKPKKPSKNTSEEETKTHITKQFKQSFKPPGEPILRFFISYDNEISMSVTNENEVLRRKAVQMTKVYAKVTCDEFEVCKSKPIPLNNTFSCFMDETFALQLCNVPGRVCLELYEKSSTMMKRKISEVPLRIPQASKMYSKEKILEDTFEKDECIHYSHEGVGSNQDISEIIEKYTSGCEDLNLYTCGSIRYYVNWLESNKGTCDIIRQSESKMMLNKDSHLDINKLNEWTNDMELDPENPKNADLLEYINDNGISLLPPQCTTQKYFRAKLHPLMIYGPPDIESNLRFKVLELRNDNELEFAAMMVTNNPKEIQMNLPTAYKKRILEEAESQAPESDSDKTVQEQRVVGRNCLKKIYSKVFQQCKNVENNLEYEDVIDEKLISYFQNSLKTLAVNFLNWFKNQSNVKNTLRKTNVILSEEQTTENAATTKVIVNITSGLNIPQRTRSKAEGNVHTFIEVTYQNVVFRTTIMQGANPKWNQQFIFHMQSNTDSQYPDSLNDYIILNLYEEYTDVLMEEKSTNWLGCIRVSLPAIYYCGKIEGLFRVTTPTANIYEENIDKTQDSAMFVSLKIRVEPTVPKLAVSMAELPSGEPSNTWKYILEWNEKYNSKFPHRKFSAFGIDVNSKTVCLTRFIAPLEPPKFIENDFNVTPEQLARYISLIPFTCTNKLCEHVCLTAKQMLNFTLGSSIDHAIALTCYFLAINVDAKLLLGYGLPNGPTAYVLVKELKDNTPIHIIFDVVTATKYNVTDSYCPLQNVFAAINDKNIWANTQGADVLILTRFDFTSRSDWHPLFTEQMVGPINSIQEKIIYVSASDTKELEFQVEKKIRKVITKLRKTRRTLWNYNVSGILKDILMKLEYNYFLGKFDVNAYMQSIQATHTINGYIIDLPYTNLSGICDIIKHSKIYEVNSPDIEFVSAVHLHAYPNKVFVVWIFIGYVICK